jgi:hypothetical protein
LGFDACNNKTFFWLYDRSGGLFQAIIVKGTAGVGVANLRGSFHLYVSIHY